MERILALETSELYGSLAVLEGDRLLCEHFLNPPQKSAQSLAPAIQDILRECRLKPKDIGKLAVSIGPGSFTGIRVGVVSAKVFAYALGIPLVGVNSLHAIAAGPAFNTTDSIELPGKTVSVAIDAQRREVVTQMFRFHESGPPEPVSEMKIFPIAELWNLSVDYFTGPILQKISGTAPTGKIVWPPEFWQPKASVIGFLAENMPNESPWDLLPIYARESAAVERKFGIVR